MNVIEKYVLVERIKIDGRKKYKTLVSDRIQLFELNSQKNLPMPGIEPGPCG